MPSPDLSQASAIAIQFPRRLAEFALLDASRLKDLLDLGGIVAAGIHRGKTGQAHQNDGAA